MGIKHHVNQDHFKIAGSGVEDADRASRERRMLGTQRARERQHAPKGQPEPSRAVPKSPPIPGEQVLAKAVDDERRRSAKERRRQQHDREDLRRRRVAETKAARAAQSALKPPRFPHGQPPPDALPDRAEGRFDRDVETAEAHISEDELFVGETPTNRRGVSGIFMVLASGALTIPLNVLRYAGLGLSRARNYLERARANMRVSKTQKTPDGDDTI